MVTVSVAMTSCPPCGIASRALSTSAARTWTNRVRSSRTGRRPLAAAHHHADRRADAAFDRGPQVHDEPRQVERLWIQQLALTERQQSIRQMRRAQRRPPDLDHRPVDRVRLRHRADDRLGVPQDHLKRVVEVVGDPARQARHGVEPLRLRHRVLRVPPLANVERRRQRGGVSANRTRNKRGEHPHVVARGPPQAELRALRVGAPALMLVQPLQDVAAIVGVNQVHDGAAHDVGGRHTAQIAECLVRVKHRAVQHEEQRYRTQVGEAVGRCAGAAVRHESASGGARTRRKSASYPGIQLLFALEPRGDSLGLVPRLVPADADAKPCTRRGGRRRHERRETLARQPVAHRGGVPLALVGRHLDLESACTGGGRGPVPVAGATLRCCRASPLSRRRQSLPPSRRCLQSRRLRGAVFLRRSRGGGTPRASRPCDCGLCGKRPGGR